MTDKQILDLAQAELRAMYKRLGINGSNVLTLIDEALRQSLVNDSDFDDNYLANNIVDARNDHNKACEIYRNYVGSAETQEERIRRINAFRLAGW